MNKAQLLFKQFAHILLDI